MKSNGKLLIIFTLKCWGWLFNITANGRVLGEVALCGGFERWEAILPNPCYKLGGYSAENLIRNDKQKI
jgi:hypothetical protein